MPFFVLGSTGTCSTALSVARELNILHEGAIGRRFGKMTLQEGYTLTLFVRNCNKVSVWINQREGTATIEATLEDEDAMEHAARCDAEIFVSFAGPPAGSKGTVSYIPPDIFLHRVPRPGISYKSMYVQMAHSGPASHFRI